MNFGEYLKTLRREKKLSQRQLADLSKISNTEVSRLESGQRLKPSPAILKAIAPHLGISYGELMKKAGYIEETISHEKYTESIFRDTDGNLQDIFRAVKNLEERDSEMLTIMKRISTELPDEDLMIIKNLAMGLLSKNKNM